MDFSATKFLVVGGDGGQKSVEMIDLEDPGNSCLFQDFPIEVSRGMGQQTPNGLFYCGGRDDSSWSVLERCFKFKETKFVDAEFKLKKPRYSASSVLYEDSFVVIGGRKGGVYFSDLEVVPEKQTMQFPNLNYGVSSSCAVVYKKHIIVTGGWTGSRETNKMSIINSSTVEEKSLNQARRYHGCTTFRLQHKDILVVAGGFHEKSTEFVLLDNNMESQNGKSSYLKIDRIQ